MTIAIASDHGGYELKIILKDFLAGQGFEILDLGCEGLESVDYPDFAHEMAAVLKEGRAGRGILICGSGIGISIAANRHAHIRAALVHDHLSAKLGRAHNDANVIVMGGRLIGVDVAKDGVMIFLNTEFEGGRHQRRIDKMS